MPVLLPAPGPELRPALAAPPASDPRDAPPRGGSANRPRASGAGGALPWTAGQAVVAADRLPGSPALRFEERESGPASSDFGFGAPSHLLWVSLGSGTLIREAADAPIVHSLRPGFVCLVPHGHPVRWRWTTPVRFALLALDPQFVQRVAREDFGTPGFTLQVSERVEDDTVWTIVRALSRETRREAAGNRVYADSLAGILAVHLLRHYAERAGDDATGRPLPRAVSRALAFIQANYAQDIGLKDIAAAAHVSPYHLSRLFKRAVGFAPYQYLIRARVAGARALLAAGGRPALADVAAAVGFVDQSHLTRHFKRAFGVTPGQAV